MAGQKDPNAPKSGVRKRTAQVGNVLRKGMPGLVNTAAMLTGAAPTPPREQLAPTPEQARHVDPAIAIAETDRGRDAAHPLHFPLAGWLDVLNRTFKEIGQDNLPLVAAGVTFYTLLALFPALGAFVALYGLFSDVGTARAQLDALSMILPPEVLKFVGDEMIRIAGSRPAGLSLTFAFSLLLSVWFANGATKAVFLGLNIAYEEREKRQFFTLTFTSLAFTIGAVLFGILMLTALLAAPAAAAFLGREAEIVISIVRWPILAVAIAGGLSLLYRFGPSRRRAKWRWINVGGGVVTLLLIAASIGFSYYIGHFANYGRTYGSLGAVIAFMIWTWVSTFIVLVGAELNAEMEHQTAHDSTIGPERPLGQRGALMADTLGAARRGKTKPEPV